MKTISTVLLSALTLVFTLSSCAAIGGIFKAGIWTGIIIVVLVVVLILWLVSRGKS